MKIRVTKSSSKHYWYVNRIGEVFEAEYGPFYGDFQYRVEDCRDGTGDAGYINAGDCEILEATALLSTLPRESQRDEIIANLAQRVTELEREVTELKRPKPVSTAAMIGEAFAKLAGCQRKVPELTQDGGDVLVKRPATYERPPCLPELTRDDVIERAKADVADLERKYSKQPMSFVKYVVNHAKCTVVALRYYCNGEVDNRGIAKCTPDDVFNVHIGKAIALRRVLGLAVPDEYVNAPKPTEVRVGDIVEYTYASVTTRYVIVPSGSWVQLGKQAHIDSHAAQGGRIIDDSREEVSA